MSAAPHTLAMNRRAELFRLDFPILQRLIGEHPLVYLDNAATSQKPRQVLNAIRDFYEHSNANVHRSIHTLGEEATDILEKSRKTVARFLGVRDSGQIIFTRGTTESFNLLASVLSRTFSPGDEILLSIMEHHANIVPWQIAAGRFGLVLRFAGIREDGSLDLADLESKINPRTKLISITQVSNVLGTINPIKMIADLAHSRGILLAVDGAQGAPSLSQTPADLGCDFYAFSGHKALGPMGIGALYGRRELLEGLGPWQGGGEMISSVTTEGFTVNELPWKFEAGTPNVEGAAGLAAALDYLEAAGRDWVRDWELVLEAYARKALSSIARIRLLPSPADKTGILSFYLEGVHSHDVAAFLDSKGIAVRAGNHCAHPLLKELGQVSTLRASFYLYNTLEEAEKLAGALIEASERL